MSKVFQRNILAILATVLLVILAVATGWAQAQPTVMDADVVVIGGGTAGLSAA